MNDRSPGTKKRIRDPDSAFNKRLRRHVTGRLRDYYAVTVPGFEALCRRELADLGFDDGAMHVDTGGVAFCGRLVDCQRANLNLRTATRVLMRVDSFVASNLRRLAKNADRIAWELFFSAHARPEIKVRSHRSRLYHTDAIAQALGASIVRRLKQAGRALSATAPQTLHARVTDDRFLLSVDSSGDPLYKRGFKSGPARAPIRETLAAAILLSAGYDGIMPLVDPMCGSGTFSLEAALMAKRMAPGRKREFAFMGWPAHADNQWAFLKREAESRIIKLDQPRIFASDIDPSACEQLKETIAQHSLSDAVEVVPQDFFDTRADHYGRMTGLVVINPPYGVRLGSETQANELFLATCRHLKTHFIGWTVALITPDRELARRIPFPSRQIPLLHGGLTLALVVGTIS